MKIDLFRYYVAVAGEQHVGRAAKQLSISPSAVSHAIATLEETYGVELFHREGKSIRLTEQGAILRDRLQAILDEVALLGRHLKDDDGMLRGPARCAGSHTVASALLAAAVVEVKARHPELVIEVTAHRSGGVRELVIQGRAEYGVCFSPLPHPGLEVHKIHEGSLVPVVRARHPLLKLKAKDQIAALPRYPAVLPVPAPGIDPCDQHPVFKRYGLKTTTAATTDSYDAAAEIIGRTDAWGFFPDVMLKLLPQKLEQISLPRAWDAGYVLAGIWLSATRTGALGSQITRAVGEVLRGRTPF